MAFEVRLLGSVEALVDGHSLALGGSKQRSVVALLALHANTTLSADELIDALWGDDPPASAAKNIQQHVSHLRKALGEGRERPRSSPAGAGTSCAWPPARSTPCASSNCWTRPLASRRASGQTAWPAPALELWRGAPLADVASEPFAPAEIRRLEELHLQALERAIDAERAAGVKTR